MNQTRKITWLIAHEPVDLFLRTAEAFREKIAELTNNKFEVEIYTISEYEQKFKESVLKDSTTERADPMSMLDSGKLQMSQMHITELARWHSPEFWALEMPFIFRDHDHATKVLEGEIGQNMLTGLVEKSPARGLAFTYSGGYRCLVSKEPISGLSEFAGVEFATTNNPVTIDTCLAIGAVPKSFSIDTLYSSKLEGKDAMVLETTIPRYLAQRGYTDKNYLINTKHNLFLTSIIIGNKFWDTLSEEEQAQFTEACKYASRLERKWSVSEATEFADKQDHSDIGVTYTELNAEDTEKFKQAIAPIYDKYRDFFYPGLIDGIIKS